MGHNHLLLECGIVDVPMRLVVNEIMNICYFPWPKEYLLHRCELGWRTTFLGWILLIGPILVEASGLINILSFSLTNSDVSACAWVNTTLKSHPSKLIVPPKIIDIQLTGAG